MIKNIIFDMGQVLLKWDPTVFIKKHNLSKEDSELVLDKVFRNYKWNLLDNGYYKDERDFLKDVLPTIPERLRDLVTDLVLDWEQDGNETPEGMLELVKELKRQGYNLFLLSNAGPRQPEYWSKLEVSKYIEHTVISAIEKQYKPCPEIFHTLLNRYNLKADECVFVDDMSANCAGAVMVGIHPVQFIGCEDLKEHLRKDFGLTI